MKTALYSAGLGDVIRAIYREAAYEQLTTTTDPMAVVVASHNPFSIEIFRYHRNARNLRLYDLGHKFEEFVEEGLRGPAVTDRLLSFAGLPHESLIRGPSSGGKPVFDAPDIVESTGHLVFCPFAGSTDRRTFSDTLVRRLLQKLWRLPVQVFLITRSFPRSRKTGKLIHGDEDARTYEGGNVCVLDHLSVPASLELIRSCKAFIGSWSSMLQAAWFEGKPTATFYPPKWCDVVNRTGYAFGLDREDCFHSDYPSLDSAALDLWLEQWAGGLVTAACPAHA